MKKLSEQELVLLKLFRELSNSDRKHIIHIAYALRNLKR